MIHELLKRENETGRYYRANLHCHSTISDGRKDVSEIKRDYVRHGYSVVAFTDHDIFMNHNDLTDGNFVALNGYEMEFGRQGTEKTCHLCFVALEDNIILPATLHRDRYMFGNAMKYKDLAGWDEERNFVRDYTSENINKAIKLGREAGFFVTYNHPTWSMESYPEYSEYKGMNAMEIFNGGVWIYGFDDDNGHAYDDMVSGGERIFCIATDDNHNAYPDGDPKCDSYIGSTMIYAEKLEYRAITKALENGDFYSSTGRGWHTGPEIKYLAFDDTDRKIYLETSPAASADVYTDTRNCMSEHAQFGRTLDKFEFTLAARAGSFRIVVRDTCGCKAYTNRYFTDDLK